MRPLSEEQMQEALAVISVGCDRHTAAEYVGVSCEDLERACRENEGFAAELRRAAASCELAHMRSLRQAAREEKNWRASVWWLERRLPDRYQKRAPGAIGRRDLARFLEAVAKGIASIVRTEEERREILDKLGQLADTLDDPLVIELTEDAQDDHEAVE